ncbi:MAG: hypothetical protein WBB74_04255 [Gaiellaceae bacterium]
MEYDEHGLSEEESGASPLGEDEDEESDVDATDTDGDEWDSTDSDE